jgi:hypothetical protein
MWQDNEVVSKNFEDAQSYCSDLILGGYSDWQLPNRKNLVNLIEYGHINPPAINEKFLHTNNNYYWTSTSSLYPSSGKYAWCIIFHSGAQTNSLKKANRNIRCVRIK